MTSTPPQWLDDWMTIKVDGCHGRWPSWWMAIVVISISVWVMIVAVDQRRNELPLWWMIILAGDLRSGSCRGGWPLRWWLLMTVAVNYHRDEWPPHSMTVAVDDCRCRRWCLLWWVTAALMNVVAMVVDYRLQNFTNRVAFYHSSGYIRW